MDKIGGKMKIEVLDIIENTDGSANVSIDCDEEFTQAAIQHYLIYILKRAIDEEDEEYQLVTERSKKCGKPEKECKRGGDKQHDKNA